MLLCRRLRNILTAHARPLSSKPTEFAPPKNENEDLNKNKGKDTLGRRLLSLIYPKRSAIVVLNKWTQEGKTIQKYQLNRVVRELRKYNRYKHALEVCEWMRTQPDIRLFGSNEVALPVAAEEGFTGLLEVTKNREMVVGDFVVEFPLNVDGLEDVTSEDLVKVDSEGRCVITDHGHFVLFNLYGPRAEEDDKERLQFKIVFFKVLQKRWESLLNQGRRVIVVGDLNIAPAAIDRCDAEPGFEKNMYAETILSRKR